MARTDFLLSLHPADECPPGANVLAKRFMRTKGYRGSSPLGVRIDDDEVLFYYYRLPEGILEVELSMIDGEWHRRVTDFITNDSDITEMIGTEEDPSEDLAEPGEVHSEPDGSSPEPISAVFKPPSL